MGYTEVLAGKYNNGITLRCVPSALTLSIKACLLQHVILCKIVVRFSSLEKWFLKKQRSWRFRNSKSRQCVSFADLKRLYASGSHWLILHYLYIAHMHNKIVT